jgi:hypothetical protein
MVHGSFCRLAAATTVAACVALPGAVGKAQAGSAVIHVDASQPGPKLNPRMYGIFLEEINHGVDGGLYAELIRNRAFEYAADPEGFTRRPDGRWKDEKGYDCGYVRENDGLPYRSLVKSGAAAGSMRVDTDKPQDNNTLAEPAKVVPVARQVEMPGSQVKHEFPPYSLTILRFKVK